MFFHNKRCQAWKFKYLFCQVNFWNNLCLQAGLKAAKFACGSGKHFPDQLKVKQWIGFWNMELKMYAELFLDATSTD